jgi:SH3-binding, glutamic acid-rich protein
MGKNKSKSSGGGRRPGKGPHPKAGQGKHNSSAAKSRSRSIGSAASLASREDLKSIDDSRSRDGAEVVHLDDVVATSPPPPPSIKSSNSSSNENYVNSNGSSSFHRATSPLPSTVTIETSVFSPIQEEPSSIMGTPSPVAAASYSNGNRSHHHAGKTPFNSPAAAAGSNGSGSNGIVNTPPLPSSPPAAVAAKAESEPEVTSSPKQPPESSPEPMSPTLAAAVDSTTNNNNNNNNAATGAKVLVLVSSSALKREVLARQQRAETLLKASNVPYELLDGADPAHKTQRDQLFQVSATKQYPQFFRVVGEDAWQFVGDWDFVESSNECGTLVQDLLGARSAGASKYKTEESAAPLAADVDVWSSNLKNHVTVDHDGPAVLDVSTDYGSGGSFSGSGCAITGVDPVVAAAGAPSATKSADKPVVVAPSTIGTAVGGKAAAAAPPLKTARAATIKKSHEGAQDDSVVDLSAPHPSERQGDARSSDDCQCAIL